MSIEADYQKGLWEGLKITRRERELQEQIDRVTLLKYIQRHFPNLYPNVCDKRCENAKENSIENSVRHGIRHLFSRLLGEKTELKVN